MATSYYPNDKEALIGYIEATMGIGLILGPIIGSFLYSFLGFKSTFYIYGCFVGLFAVVITWKAPAEPEVHSSEFTALIEFSDESLSDPLLTQPLTEQGNNKLRAMDLLKQPRFLLAATSSGYVYFMYTFLEPILAQRLQTFDLSTLQIGAFFTIEPVFYISASILI